MWNNLKHKYGWSIIGGGLGLIVVLLLWPLLNALSPEIKPNLATSNQYAPPLSTAQASNEPNQQLNLTGGGAVNQKDLLTITFKTNTILSTVTKNPDDFYQALLDIDRDTRTGLSFNGIGADYLLGCNITPGCVLYLWSDLTHNFNFVTNAIKISIQDVTLTVILPAFLLGSPSQLNYILRSGNDKIKVYSFIPPSGIASLTLANTEAVPLVQNYQKSVNRNRIQTDFHFPIVAEKDTDLNLKYAILSQDNNQLDWEFQLESEPDIKGSPLYQVWLDTDVNPATGQPIRDGFGADYLLTYSKNSSNVQRFQDGQWKTISDANTTTKLDFDRVQFHLSLDVLGAPNRFLYLLRTADETRKIEYWWPGFGYLNWIRPDNNPTPVSIQIDNSAPPPPKSPTPTVVPTNPKTPTPLPDASLRSVRLTHDNYYLLTTFSLNYPLKEEQLSFSMESHNGTTRVFYTISYNPKANRAILYRWSDKLNQNEVLWSFSPQVFDNERKINMNIPLYLLNAPDTLLFIAQLISKDQYETLPNNLNSPVTPQSYKLR